MDTIKFRSAIVALAIAVAAAGCSPVSSTTQTASDRAFTLTVSVPPGAHHAADDLGLVATLTYEGPQPSITVDGDDRGLVWFSFKQLDGSREMGGLSRLICSPPTTMLRGSAAIIRPAKNVGYDAGDPNAAFYELWASDPAVHLPPGRWRIAAFAQIWDGETCIGANADHVITPSPLVLDVVP